MTVRYRPYLLLHECGCDRSLWTICIIAFKQSEDVGDIGHHSKKNNFSTSLHTCLCLYTPSMCGQGNAEGVARAMQRVWPGQCRGCGQGNAGGVARAMQGVVQV